VRLARKEGLKGVLRHMELQELRDLRDPALLVFASVSVESGVG
jgi:hypothetical protein